MLMVVERERCADVVVVVTGGGGGSGERAIEIC